jgi:hypothetical protein
MGTTEKEFPDGLFVAPPHPNAPSFIKGRISVRIGDFIAYLSKKDPDSFLNVDIKEGFKQDEAGNPKWYAQVDTWVKPSERVTDTATQEDDDGPLPF